MVFNSVDPCQEFVFKGDVIERVQTFKYLGILLETTPNLDNAMEHLATASRCSLFALNHRCAKLRIMDIKLRCDLFNMLVCSTTNYACEVWVDSKKIKVIEIVYRGFLKSLLGVRKITSTSIMLVEFGKFPFEHFGDKRCCTYNRVSTITKDHILEKAWEAQLAMLVVGKKCWVQSVKKWLLENQSQEMAGSLPLVQPSLETAPQFIMTRAFQVKTVQSLLEMAPGTTHIHSTHLVGVRGQANNQVFWCNTHNI